MDAYSNIKEHVAGLVHSACSKLKYPVAREEVLRSLEEPRDAFGDLACTLAFELAKRLKTAPRSIAEKIKNEIAKDERIERVEVAGAGYINFFFNYAVFAGEVIESARGENFGAGENKRAKVLVEFPSVNPNKPWHVGHMRNAILGDSVARVLERAGYEVERESYIDDLGLQVAQSLWGYLHLSSKTEGKIDHWLGEQYVEVAKRMEDAKVDSEVREIMKKLEHGEGEVAENARALTEKCVLAQHETAFKLKIFHDVLIWESDIVKSNLLKLALEKMLASGAVARESEGKNAGCTVARMEGEEFENMESPDKVLVRSDGTATYTGKDIAFQMWKFGILPLQFKYKKFLDQPNGKTLYSTARAGENKNFGKAKIVINVIGVEQKYPQRVVYSVLENMGYKNEAKNSIHLSYEHAWLPDEKFSGRKGTWIGYSADEVVDEGIKRAHAEIKERFKDMGEDERKEIARVVGVGAIRFSFIRTTPEKKIIFKWEDALNFEGDSAPYLQYSYARAHRIIEKSGEEKTKKQNCALLVTSDEKKLVKTLARFPFVVEQAAREYRPHIIADYLLDLATSFNKFYTSCPVLSAEEGLRDARLALVEASANALRIGLDLIGIEAPRRM
ncbi:MAG: arginine--tRNA ligase [Candidatus Micrarchaeota archaeon]